MATDMSPERMKELLDRLVENVSNGNNCKEAIKHLLWLGFTADELYKEFNFGLADISDAMDEMKYYEEN